MSKLIKSIKHAHDAFVKEIMSDLSFAKEFFSVYLPSEILERIDLTTLTLQPTSLINDVRQESTMDMLFKVAQINPVGIFYLIVEHQSKADPLMPHRINKYSNLVIDYHLRNSTSKILPMVYTLVLYHGREKECCSPDIRSSVNSDEVGVSYFKKFKVINYTTLKDNQLDTSTRVGLVGYLLKHIYEKELFPYLAKIMNNISELAKAGYQHDVEVMLEYALVKGEIHDQEALYRLIRSEYSFELGGTIMTLGERLINEGIQIGIQQGIKQGIQNGVSKGRYASKLEVAKLMLENGIAIATIVKCTGLKIKTIEEMQLIIEREGGKSKLFD